MESNKKEGKWEIKFLFTLAVLFVFILGFTISLEDKSAEVKPEKKKAQYHWVKEVSIEKMEDTVIDGNNLCLMTVSKKNESVTFRTSEYVCESLRESNVKKVDIAYNGSMVIKDLNIYVMGEKVKFK